MGILIGLLIAIIGAIPLYKLAQKVGVKIGGFGVAMMILFPFIQIFVLYYLAFKERGEEVNPAFVTTAEEKARNAQDWNK
ncbi:hypothetical protein [Vibrio gazogenes]|uniref:Uncharacterized protein n=1 Tax=Vibrio gazogenes DSM 21264 = NBRC 103151 TaxID=1123492 RepID=A0A1M5F9F6_VIBGA|nr:hypothetical protein [Vibrio gazogenes]USP15449.1 hypothetical protein MKS89_18800 [Vibrio gazogenes]SHF87722.1 hypothetical protein SAMN02745781_03388 [Vibrio gazogenes DSM 21264] [Vibrio gazogenes DSM 21264 = NBRC 103151]SJN54516.1 hypothetical protein BQ6471_01051 [Vibrio gazogenes]